ncbi:Variant-specific surface protein, partial [Giardia duodenalis]
VCGEARDGACVRHAEEVTGQGKSLKAIDRQTSGTCPEATSGASQTGQCKNGKCDVWIGGGDFCSQCSKNEDYLINGKCTADNTESACEGSASNGMCTSCKSGYFLHRGGCYQIGTEPGNLVCKDTAASSTQGTCDACRPGYFRNPVTVLDKTKQSCIACNDTTGADNNVGIASCTECTAPATSGSSSSSQKATCTACADGYFIGGDGSACTACSDSTNGVTDCTACVPREDNSAKAKCTACSGSKKPSLDGKSCYDCTIGNCASCNSGGACQKCTNSLYLKTETDGATSCVSKCPDGYFGHTATDDGLKTCQSCSGTNDNLDPTGAGVAGCAACTYDSAKVTCTKCETGKYLKTTSDSTSCVEASGCGSGFFPKADDKAGNRCVPCGEAGSGGITNCAECSLFPYKQNLSYSHRLLCAADWASTTVNEQSEQSQCC